MSIKAQSLSVTSKSNIKNLIDRTLTVLVIGGGGGGGYYGGGGGAGGWQEQSLSISTNTLYTVSIGAGGTASTAIETRPSLGSPTYFSGIISVGGGSAGTRAVTSSTATLYGAAYPGASGGGTYANALSGGGQSVGQGNAGGVGTAAGFSGGGGGAGAIAGTATAGVRGGAGGAGKVSTITGLAYAGGGGGGSNNAGNFAAGGSGGGGRGGSSTGQTVGSAGGANTGGGGGGGALNAVGGSGGSGVVILKFNSGLNIDIGVGLTHSSIISGKDRIVTITAGTDTVRFY